MIPEAPKSLFIPESFVLCSTCKAHPVNQTPKPCVLGTFESGHLLKWWPTQERQNVWCGANLAEGRVSGESVPGQWGWAAKNQPSCCRLSEAHSQNSCKSLMANSLEKHRRGETQSRVRKRKRETVSLSTDKGTGIGRESVECTPVCSLSGGWGSLLGYKVCLRLDT